MPEMHLQNFEKLQSREPSERSNSVCAKRNFICGVAVTSLGASPLHLRQRLNIVHLCRAGRQWSSRFARNDVACATQMMLCLWHKWKIREQSSRIFDRGGRIWTYEWGSQSPLPYRLAIPLFNFDTGYFNIKLCPCQYLLVFFRKMHTTASLRPRRHPDTFQPSVSSQVRNPSCTFFP